MSRAEFESYWVNRNRRKRRLASVEDTPLQNGVAVFNGNSLATVDEFNAWLGGDARYQLISFNQTSWAAFASDINFVRGFWPVGTRGMWSIPLACEFGTLPDVVAGVHDNTFRLALRAVLEIHPPGEQIPIRTGWEFQLLGQTQRAYDAAGNPTPEIFVAAFQHFVDLAREESPRFKVSWCPDLGPMTANGLTTTDCYPGDDYADFFSGDLYFASPDSTTDGGSGIFTSDKTATAGLDWLVAFAAAHGKRWGLWEFGCDSDEAPIWLRKVLEYLAVNDAFLSGYWNNGIWKLSADAKPGLSTIFKKAWGPPKVMNPDLGLISGAAGSLQLVAQSEPFYPTTYGDLGGVNASSFALSSAGLLAYGALSGAKSISVRMSNSLWSVTRSLTPSFAPAYVFTNPGAAAYVANMTTPPTEGVKAILDAFWTAAGAIVAKLDGCYLRALHTEQAMLLNMALNPDGATYTGSVKIGATLFWPFLGNWCTAQGARLNTQIAYNRAGSKFTKNAASVGVLRKNNMKKNGGIGLTNTVGVSPRNDSGNARATVNSFTPIDAGAVADVGTLVVCNRSGASAMEMYIDGALVGSNTSAAADPADPTKTFQEGQQGSDFWGDIWNAFAFMGGSLTAGEIATLNSAAKTVVAALAANA